MLAIKVENISKQYRLGQIGTGTLSHDLNRLWYKLRGKEDPYLKIGEANQQNTKGESDYVWALQNINFEIQKGEIVGIIGKNGAGKSTLLKILSKITYPTTGKIYINGRISSLLEVGTGFNPEMTGRENIYLNGTILGMTRKEISQKIDKIIAFAEVERYIDTPVKRYSSGMRVRLAFSVSAHLDSEILIIDEVLAVGDANFQRKCLESIKQLNQEEGRTILFVSHNMHTVSKLCTKIILLENGKIIESGAIEEVISRYITNNQITTASKLKKANIENTEINITNFSFIQNGKKTKHLLQGKSFECEFTVENTENKNYNLFFNVELKTKLEEPITFFGNQFQNIQIMILPKEKKRVKVFFSDLYLRKAEYSVSLFFNTNTTNWKTGTILKNAFTLYVIEPELAYWKNPSRNWRDFSISRNHSYLPIKIEKLEINKT